MHSTTAFHTMRENIENPVKLFHILFAYIHQRLLPRTSTKLSSHKIKCKGPFSYVAWPIWLTKYLSHDGEDNYNLWVPSFNKLNVSFSYVRNYKGFWLGKQQHPILLRSPPICRRNVHIHNFHLNLTLGVSCSPIKMQTLKNLRQKLVHRQERIYIFVAQSPSTVVHEIESSILRFLHKYPSHAWYSR